MIKSNKCIYFFLLFLSVAYCLPAQGKYTPNGGIEVILEAARQSFDKNEYPKSLEFYEKLSAEGYLTEQMLLRMAFLYESQNRYPEAIFALRKANESFKGPPVEAKITRLREQLGRRSVFPAERPSFWHSFVSKWELPLVGLMAICMALGLGGLFFRKKAGIRALGMMSLVIGLLAGGIWVHHHYFQPKRAVIIAATSYYDQPGYAAPILSLPLSPGTTVTIDDRHDIWVHICLERIECWVPGFVVKEL